MSAVAAMQLWGKYNLVTSNAALTREEVKALELLKPTAIAMYAPKREQIDTFWASLPAWALRPSKRKSFTLSIRKCQAGCPKKRLALCLTLKTQTTSPSFATRKAQRQNLKQCFIFRVAALSVCSAK